MGCCANDDDDDDYTFGVSVSVALVIQLHRILLSSAGCLTFSHKRYDVRKNVIEHKIAF
jgi:hypothetical protein